jgi:hypothetical protein
MAAPALPGRPRPLCRAIFEQGVRLDPTTVRSLGAIHLAAALDLATTSTIWSPR